MTKCTLWTHLPRSVDEDGSVSRIEQGQRVEDYEGL